MYSASLLSLEVKVKVWKVSGGTQLTSGIRSIPPVRPFLTNLQAAKSCLRPIRTLHYHRFVSFEFVSFVFYGGLPFYRYE